MSELRYKLADQTKIVRQTKRQSPLTLHKNIALLLPNPIFCLREDALSKNLASLRPSTVLLESFCSSKSEHSVELDIMIKRVYYEFLLAVEY